MLFFYFVLFNDFHFSFYFKFFRYYSSTMFSFSFHCLYLIIQIISFTYFLIVSNIRFLNAEKIIWEERGRNCNRKSRKHSNSFFRNSNIIIAPMLKQLLEINWIRRLITETYIFSMQKIRENQRLKSIRGTQINLSTQQIKKSSFVCTR